MHTHDKTIQRNNFRLHSISRILDTWPHFKGYFFQHLNFLFILFEPRHRETQDMETENVLLFKSNLKITHLKQWSQVKAARQMLVLFIIIILLCS